MSVLESSSKSKYFLMFILFMIGLGFALSTCDNNMRGSSVASVAKVNGVEIPQEKFSQAIQNYGLAELTHKQLKQLNFGKTIVEGLISEELFKQWGSTLELSPSKDEVAEEIKKLPYFLNEQKSFDLNRYKALLKANRMTPQDFETSTTDALLLQRTQLISQWVPFSTSAAKTNFMLKNTGANLSVLKLKPSSLKSLIPVSESKIKEFLADSKNFTLLNNLYERNKHHYVAPSSYKIKEVSASFTSVEEKEKILASLKTFKNISTVTAFNKESEKFVKSKEESRSNVDHGWLSEPNLNFSDKLKASILSSKKNTVVGPEINEEQVVLYYVEDVLAAKNISFETAKSELVANHIREQGTKEREELTNIWREKSKILVLNNNVNEIQRLTKQYGWEWVDDTLFNKSEKNLLGSIIQIEDIKSIHQSPEGSVLILNSLADVLIVKIKKHLSLVDKSIASKWEKEQEEFLKAFERQLAMEQSQKIKKELMSKASIWENEAFY